MKHDAAVSKPPRTVPMPHDWVPRPHQGDAVAPYPPPDPPPPPYIKK